MIEGIDILAVCKIYKEKHNNMPKLTESLEATLLKPYSKWAMKIRRIIINLYRPILHDRSESIFNLDLLFYLMFTLFGCSGILLAVGVDQPEFGYPFLAGWVLVFITQFYLRYFPQTWAEMYDYEKAAFRELHRLRKNWSPKLKK